MLNLFQAAVCRMDKSIINIQLLMNALGGHIGRCMKSIAHIVAPCTGAWIEIGAKHTIYTVDESD
jgi:hypothetical protein